MVGSSPFVVAHQGGWDELLLFAVPAIAVVLFVFWAERKARSRHRSPAGDGEEAGTTMPGREQRPEKDS